MRTTPELITSLGLNEIFVFGSNLAGRHGKGAAKIAMDKFGARYGQGEGFSFLTYAIPTKGYQLEVLSLSDIKRYVDRFLAIAPIYPQFTFLVTPIGCGLAGYTPEQIAPMFKGCPANVALPACFLSYLGQTD
jgi:hypothetical protein